jgi:alpha-N-arabinofuranosidase
MLALSISILLLVSALALPARAASDGAYANPVIPGFYPDPSVCRVGEDYYLVNSTFEYFPGVPVFHSKDLVNWKQIGNCLTRPSQLPLAKVWPTGGIFAPTIRYHDGTFYVSVTIVGPDGGNIIVTTKNPAGEWSEPVRVDRGGIDPSLFFDDDGKVYFTGTSAGNESPGIYQAEIDVKTGKLLGPTKAIWSGTGGRYPEGPHLYKIRGTYYLMIAEGGTEYGHMQTIARSASPWGPFEPYAKNPILTHRNLGNNPIQGTGHADLVQAHDGSWWMVFLAFRSPGQYQQFHHLGRETFLAPVTWTDDGWPVVNGTGTVTVEMRAKTLPLHPVPAVPAREEFDTRAPGIEWLFVRNPSAADWSLSERPGWLRLKGSAVTLDDQASLAFLGRRQQHFDFEATTLLDFRPGREGEEAGLVLRMNEGHHYEIAVDRSGAGRRVLVRCRLGRIESVVAAEPIGEGPVRLRVRGEPATYTLSFAVGSGEFKDASKLDTRYLSSEVAGGFNGVVIGLYATGRGRAATAPADFDWFEYRAAP